MKTFFTILGLTIVITLAILFAAVACLLFFDRQLILYIAKSSFLTGVIAAAVFVITLLLIPHGRRG